MSTTTVHILLENFPVFMDGGIFSFWIQMYNFEVFDKIFILGKRFRTFVAGEFPHQTLIFRIHLMHGFDVSVKLRFFRKCSRALVTENLSRTFEVLIYVST